MVGRPYLTAEYGTDPTGVGNVLGLTEMGEIKQQLAREAAEAAPVIDLPPVMPNSYDLFL